MDIILSWVIQTNATIKIDNDVVYNMETKQATIKYTVIAWDVTYDRFYNLTQQETELRWEDDNYIIDIICSANGFQRL